MDSFGRADIDTGLAVNAHVLVDLCLLVLHGDCRCGTFTHAGFTPGTFIGINDCYQCIHSTVIASEGQTSTQVWQSTHMSLSTFAFSFSMAIAEEGHSLTQVSHPVHLSMLTIATNSFTPSYMFLLLTKKGFLLRSTAIRMGNVENIRWVFGHDPAGSVTEAGSKKEEFHQKNTMRDHFFRPSMSLMP